MSSNEFLAARASDLRRLLHAAAEAEAAIDAETCVRLWQFVDTLRASIGQPPLGTQIDLEHPNLRVTVDAATFAPPIDLATVVDPHFTHGLTPVEYLRALREGETIVCRLLCAECGEPVEEVGVVQCSACAEGCPRGRRELGP